MGTFNSKKFRFAETFTNTNGKTSGSGFIGVLLGLIAGGAFIAGVVAFYLQVPDSIELLKTVINLVFAAAALLGVRKVSGNIGHEHHTEEQKG